MIYYLTVYCTILELFALLQSLYAYETPSNLYALLADSFSNAIPNSGILLRSAPGDELFNDLSNPLTYNSLDSGEGVATIPPTMIHMPTLQDNVEGVQFDSDKLSKLDVLHKLHQDLLDEQDLVFKSAVLIKMLGNPYLDKLPVLYVEEDEPDDEDDEEANDFVETDSGNNNLHVQPSKIKRSRYYRRYPWKRHSRHRSKYEPELRYACTPTKEDVFKLLVNLHENRNGKNGKMITFCNRKRPARAIFTNIRFMG